jgi:tetratricopeptide (TPR) repeat protein
LRRETVDYSEVEAALNQARRRLGGGPPDALRERLDGLRQDLAMTRRLDRMLERPPLPGAGQLDAAEPRDYAQAFREHGLSVGERPAAELADKVRRSPIRATLLDGLDLWREQEARLNRGKTVADLAELLRLADPDEQRNRVRDALDSGDEKRLAAALEDVEPSRLSPLLAVRVAESPALSPPLRQILIEAVWRQHPRHFAMAYQYGWHSLLALQRSEEAEGLFRAALTLRPGHAGANYGMARAILERQEYVRAVPYLQKAAELDPTHFEIRASLGEALLAAGRPDQAAAAYRKALDLLRSHPGSAQAHPLLAPLSAKYLARLGDACRTGGKPDEAAAAYREALDNDPRNADTHCALGSTLRDAGRLDKAITAYRKAIEINPEHALAHHGLALTLLRTGRPFEGYRLLDRALANHPDWAKDATSWLPYTTACCAALAGCGQGKDAPPEAERPKLRRRALGHLRAALDVWARDLDNDAAKYAAAVRKELQYWQQDSAFAGVRDKEALAKLPFDERQGWEQLWADVEALAKRTEAR